MKTERSGYYETQPDYSLWTWRSRGLTIKNRWRYLRGIAAFMMCNNPSIEHVYAIYNRKGLAQEYRDSAFDKHNSIESRYIFKDMLEREGELII